MPLFVAAADSFEPSEEDAIDLQFRGLGADVAVHDAPLSSLVYIVLPHATAASFEPSEEDVAHIQSSPGVGV